MKRAVVETHGLISSTRGSLTFAEIKVLYAAGRREMPVSNVLLGAFLCCVFVLRDGSNKKALHHCDCMNSSCFLSFELSASSSTLSRSSHTCFDVPAEKTRQKHKQVSRVAAIEATATASFLSARNSLHGSVAE